MKKVKDILSKINDKNINSGEFNINNIQESKYKNGKYIGSVFNGLREGKGIYYYNNGDRQMVDFFGGHPIGKHVLFTNNGEIETINY